MTASPAAAEPWPVCRGGHRAERHVSCVIDGDTIWLKGEKIRLLDVDTAELGGRCNGLAEKARDYLARRLGEGRITVERHGFGVYGHPLARIYVDGRDIGQELLALGLARPYRPGGWCR
nr:thermonuclease family protein [Rhodobium orientis]